MEITKEILEQLYKRIQEVFIAQTTYKPDNIELMEDGTFFGTWAFPYNDKIITRIITIESLTNSLDELIKERELKEEIEREEQDKRNKENNLRYEREQKASRLATYNKLKAEFGE